MPTEWFYQELNDVCGPLSPSELLDRVRKGDIRRDTPIRKNDSQWVPASQVGGLFEAADQTGQQLLCPYCGHEIEPPPTSCGECGRRIEISFVTRRSHLKQEARKKAEEALTPEVAEERERRRDIRRYALLLVVWAVLLVVAAYVNQIVFGGSINFDRNMIIWCIAGGTLVLGASFYWVWRVS